ncbi:alkaline phosphatase D family protein [Pseudoalteromonas sp. SG45-5]|uniref:alkaline phosphatase D family protein n=1 Tax=unclassified Pseudoalteromonas TaxID=194690 RepID=UPI0015F99DC2|nr:MULTISPECIES: alkaline phosphatase D family protein [unclassified Pseudoalteromonas]MBB1386870.1 alkaline phosphatase D family protein [Pseudoalteromonas sp. SG45-5]MBB1394976.1 alkaline phosphatase D family protein [Pseudoalteromonas sp. SG44-4]MBB1448191.1 alkaline phosphatase D family protein [Pseudoalteromonas sp. SG41-6]
MSFTRRTFLKASAAGFGAAVLSFGLTGCAFDDNGDVHIPVSFDHGVASGDPLNDSLIIWTRVTPKDTTTNSLKVQWQVALDPQFTTISHDGEAQISNATDFTLKVDLQGLRPNTAYYYRFNAHGKTSPVGQGKTLPIGDIDKVKLAVVSCANYPAGYFHVYGEIAKQPDLDAVIHLGDYIYEYGNDGYATEDAAKLGRLLPEDNQGEIITLSDYRKRYANYRLDGNLQAAHSHCAFITVWDDHEVANDTWRDGAQNHNSDEGDFSERKLQALQAYFEWMPIRNVADKERIYRRFEFGNLVSLYMLDTRMLARDKPLDYADFELSTATGQGEFVNALGADDRALLGSEQLTWLTDGIKTSDNRWQVLGQQVLMTKMHLPIEVMLLLSSLQTTQASGGDPRAMLAQANILFAELAQIKIRVLKGDPTVTPAELARVETTVPYNLDAWDGYAYEREVLLGTAVAAQKNLVVLAGDTHNAWAGQLKTDTNNPIAASKNAGVEFATASVSSPGLEEYLALTTQDAQTVAQIEQVIALLVNDLAYNNLVNRGYLTVTFTKEQANAQWNYVSTIKAADYQILEERKKGFIMLAGQPQLLTV